MTKRNGRTLNGRTLTREDIRNSVEDLRRELVQRHDDTQRFLEEKFQDIRDDISKHEEREEKRIQAVEDDVKKQGNMMKGLSAISAVVGAALGAGVKAVFGPHN